jgi:5-methylcytosine-specific restriction endonuclease McrA
MWKTCEKCKEKMPGKAFSKCKSAPGGVDNICKICRRIEKDLELQRRINKATHANALKKLGGKVCTSCGLEYSTKEFHKNNHTLDGLSFICKTCTRAKKQAYQQTKKGRLAARKRTQKRRARKNNVITEDIDVQKIYDFYGNRCVYCGKIEDLTLDHIVAISVGGPHIESNLVVACKSCNSSKGAKPVAEWLATRPCRMAPEPGSIPPVLPRSRNAVLPPIRSDIEAWPIYNSIMVFHR